MMKFPINFRARARAGFRAFMAVALLGIAFGSSARAGDVGQDLESLGGNEEIVKRANNLERRSRASVVQGRTVSRDLRLEFGVNYGPVAAGDSYLRTQNLGGQVDFHITPKVSLGVRYAKAFNQLTAEGRQQFEDARNARAGGAVNSSSIPDIDYPEESVMGVLNWYMLYGKVNLFDLSVVQFDIYTLGGYGQIKLASGSANTWTAGGGIGFWLSQHLTSRFELRYQSYADQVYSGSRDLNLIVANVGLGVLL